MASLAEMAAARGRTIDNSTLAAIKVQQIHYTKLHPSEMNFYGQNEIEEMADSIALAGIIQPLIVRKTDMGEYEVIVGHRRRLGTIMNVERGMKEFEFLPCIEIKASDKMIQEIKKLSDITDKEAEDIYVRYILIASNSINRELTDFERMEQAMELKVIIPYMRGDTELKGRALRAEVAKEMKRSTGQVGTYEAIYNNLILEGLERFRNEEIGISVAAGLASLPKEIQKQLVSKQDLKLADIERAKEIRNGTVSESDTERTVQVPIPTRIESHLEEQENEAEYEDVPAAVEQEASEEEGCNHSPKCYLCNVPSCNSRQEQRTKCIYDSETSCNIENAIKLMYANEPELEKECPGCCMRCEKKRTCGYACYNAKTYVSQPTESQSAAVVPIPVQASYKINAYTDNNKVYDAYADNEEGALERARKFLGVADIRQITINIRR